jgi:hypothetical protein
MLSEPLDEQYFNWLYRRVRPDNLKTPLAGYEMVCGEMHRIVFDDRVPNDDNRSADGKELRREFIEEQQDLKVHDCREWLSLDASIFEMIVALCDRCEFIAPLTVKIWFEIFLNNLGLCDYRDNELALKNRPKVRHALRKLNSRTYKGNGVGGLFPLKNPSQDQRNVEIWYQMAKYLDENHMY